VYVYTCIYIIYIHIYLYIYNYIYIILYQLIWWPWLHLERIDRPSWLRWLLGLLISQKMSKAATCSISSMQWSSIGSMSKYFKCQSMYSESPAMQVALVLLHRQSFKYPRWKVFLTESASTSLSSSTSASCCVRLCSEVAWWLLIRRLLRHQFMSQHSPSCQQHLHVRPRRKCF